MFGGTSSPTSRKPSSDPVIPKDYKGSSEQCFPLEAAVPGSSKEPKSTNPASAKPTQSPALLWHFPETPFLLLNTSLISTDSRCPWWENNQTWVRVLSSQMQYPSIMIWTPSRPSQLHLCCTGLRGLSPAALHPPYPGQTVSQYFPATSLTPENFLRTLPSKMPIEIWLGRWQEKKFVKASVVAVNRKCHIVS